MDVIGLYKAIKFLLLHPKHGVLELSKRDYLRQCIIVFSIIGISWGVIFALYFHDDAVNNISTINILKGILSWFFPQLFIAIIFYSIILLFKGIASLKNILQLMISIGIIEGIIFLPLYFSIFGLLPFSETNELLGKMIGIIQFIWEFFVLRYYGELIANLRKSKSIVVSMITLIIIAIIDITVMWLTWKE